MKETQIGQEPFRSAMFSLFPETIRNLTFLSNEQLGEIMRALFAHYWEPETDYSGEDAMLSVIYNFVSDEMNRYTDKCRKNSRNGSRSGKAKPNEAKEERTETKTERNETKHERNVTQDQGQDQGQGQSQSKVQSNNQNKNKAQNKNQSPDADRRLHLPPAAKAREARQMREEIKHSWMQDSDKPSKTAALCACGQARASPAGQESRPVLLNGED